MWETIKTQTTSAVLTAVILAVVAMIWQSVASGGLIRALGGVAPAEVADFVSRADLVDLVDLVDLKVVSRVTGQNTPSPVLDCGDGWTATSARFHESYRDGNTQREKHFLICMK